MELKVIAHIRTDFPEKFGIPRQSGMVKGVKGRIVFLPEYRNPDAIRGIEGFSHLWLIWGFSEVHQEEGKWCATVAPPRLGGRVRMGVFATRSPYRPNPIGLSSVKLEGVEFDKNLGHTIVVSGVDMLDGTPIYDIKPYLPYADAHIEAVGGFTENLAERKLQVDILCDEFTDIPEEKQNEIIKVLEQDPTPSYKKDGEEYGMRYGEYEIKFHISDKILYITKIL